ncbi:MAG TPA: cbb3-type cytochrome c oxidase subunit I [Acetobacteraceae bacterium]
MLINGGALVLAASAELVGVAHPVIDAAIPQYALLLTLLAIVPSLLGGFGYIFVPSLIGAPQMAFPRLDAFGLLLLASAILLAIVGLFQSAPAPQTICTAVALLLGGSNALLLALSQLVTIINMRGTGVTLLKLPLMVWTQLVAACVVVMVLPVLAAGTTVRLMLPASADIHEGWLWPLMWPLIYVMVLPALGLIAEVLYPSVKASRKARACAAYGLLIIAVFGVCAWMYAVLSAHGVQGLEWVLVGCAALLLLALIPIARNWREFGVAQLWALGALFVFATGIAAELALLWLHRANGFSHFYYVLSLGCLFGGLAGLFCWFEPLLGRRLPRKLGLVQFLSGFIGVNFLLLPEHVLAVFPQLPPLTTPQLWPVLFFIGTGLSALSIAVLAAMTSHALMSGERPAGDFMSNWSAISEKTARAN